MAWGGLSKTEVFMKLSDVDRARITNTIGAEFYNENYNGTFPNGEKACD
jgi:outer membrane scaffolding protein for murein synthesis (MipA/OmpV family)